LRRRPTKATQTNVLRTAFRSAPSADIIDFQSFVSNHPNRVSNTFTGWYQVPLFVFTRQLARKICSADGNSGSAIPQIVRDNASGDGRKVMLIAEFAAPIATLIGRAAYRQIDYERLMQIGHPVARYLYKRLVHRYTYADMTNTYHFRFSAIRDAGMLDSYSSRVDKQRPVVKTALDELAALGAKLPGADRVSPKLYSYGHTRLANSVPILRGKSTRLPTATVGSELNGTQAASSALIFMTKSRASSTILAASGSSTDASR